MAWAAQLGELVEPGDDGRAGTLDLGTLLRPRLAHGAQQLQEVLAWVVGAGVERLTLGGQEARHRPPALAGQGGRRGHVHGVDVGPLLAVDLHGHEAGVDDLGHGLVLERLVRHDVAPVARGIPH